MRRILGGLLWLASAALQAQGLAVYDDQLRNGFVAGYSYNGSVSFSNATPTFAGSAASIAFTSSGFGAVAFPNESLVLAGADYSSLRFQVHGGSVGGQQLRLQVYSDLGATLVADVDLDSYIDGGAVVANAWREVIVPIGAPPLTSLATFRRFDVQVEGGAQPTLYLDEVRLVAAGGRIFADGFDGAAAPSPGQVRFVDAPANLGRSLAENGGVVNFQVERINGSSGAVSVQLQVAAGGSATSPVDYVITTATASWAAGESGIRNLGITVADDALDEPDETANLQLGNATGGAVIVAPSTATLTILDDDVAGNPGALRFSATLYRASETDGDAVITVERTGGSSGAVAVDVATGNGSATAPADYVATAVTLNWADGDSTPKQVLVPIVDDAAIENDEMLALELSAPTGGASLGAPSTATLMISDPELLFVPQFSLGATGSIKVFRRVGDDYQLLNTAVLPNDTNPNAVAFAPDGKLWVVDGGNTNRLLRYSRAAIMQQAVPVAEAIITPTGNGTGDYVGLAFFGDFAYLAQGSFNGAEPQRVLKLALTDLQASGSPAPTALLTNANFSFPAGLAFDPEGRLWVSNYLNDRVVRIDPATGTVDKIAQPVAVGARGSLSAPEGLAFDAQGSLWVGNNGRPTMVAYADWQIADAGFGATAPVHLSDLAPGLEAPDFNPHTGYIGGLAFNGDGELWINYQFEYAVRGFDLVAETRPGGLPGVGGYEVSDPRQVPNATTDPGFGGLAAWPVPATLNRQPPVPAQFRGTTLVGMESSFTYFDAGTGPVEDTDYPRHDERIVDYYAGKGMTALRFLVCWEALQSELMGPIPAANAGNYKTYFDNYERIVDYATNVKGMTVQITPWQYDDDIGGIGGPTWRGDLVGSAEVPIEAWRDFWTKLAAIFADNPRVEFVLVTEPNGMSTMEWWSIAQEGIDAIRAAGATQRIHVPGNGYTAASSWTSNFYDTAATKRSNAYGWLNANGPGQPISDPLNRLVAEVHTYVNTDKSGSTDEIESVTAARDNLAQVVNEARARGYLVYLGEMGWLASKTVNGGGATGVDAWADFVDYLEANSDVLIGFTWWAGGDPRGWWPDIGANGGGHFSISPTNAATYTGDTINMDMIEGDF
jgi:aryl-phospho-beta-D-glucosidase BglC (GH1 family)